LTLTLVAETASLLNERCCNGFSESSIHGSDDHSASSSQRCMVEQPNIDLQVSLTQRWPGLNALLIDVAPYCLLVNECDLELTLVDENESSWTLPAGKTFSPPFFHEVSFVMLYLLKNYHNDDGDNDNSVRRVCRGS